MTGLYLAQLLLPLILVGCMLWLPARSRLGFAVQCVGSFAALAVMALRGIWLLPPWWAPYAFGAALVAAALVGLRRSRSFASAMPGTWGAWIVAASFVALGAASLVGTAGALQSRTPPPRPVVNLAFPLAPGRYLVVNGGSDFSTNAHLFTLDASEPRLRDWRGQSYGVDLVQLNGLGLRAKGLQPADPRAYCIYATRVLAPCAGPVVRAVDGLPDMQVPEMDREHMAGNHVMLRCHHADVLLGHLSPGSVQVRAGDTVAAGVWLGSVGNSGNTGEPHLHVHAQRPGPVGAPLGGDPLPIRLNGRFPVRGDRIGPP
ncbi:M23 family metallopeptidase [uncultured Thiodictyon sp.]|uniref:peptidoglycan DD-metalloendopeptidase family protein n=1 Tax=uncultured Thiodictyon sp. TaxID=1846217 RepID=UPI0025EA5888|nr:M23 family metallopeptidase [uncultured Thiodictyon sp.]